MKKIFLSVCLMLAGLVVVAGAQINKTESARKAAEKLLKGDRAGAIAILDKAIEQRKDLQETYQMRGAVRGGMGDLDGAIADYTEALKITPNNAVLYERRAMFRMFRRDSAGALEDFDAAIAHGLKSERVYVGRAAIKHDIGDIEGAIADYKLALTINPMLASANDGLAFMYERRGELNAAIVLLQDFLDRYESQRDGRLPQVQGISQTGASVSVKREGKEKDGSQVFLEGGEFLTTFKANTPEGLERQQAKIEQTMNLALAYAHLGSMYEKRNETDKALESYEKGLRIKKDDPYIHKLRSQIRLKRGDLPGAIEDLNVVANSRMGAPDRHADKGILLLLQGKDDEAEKEFALHLRMFPNDQEFLNKKIGEAKKVRSQQPQQ